MTVLNTPAQINGARLLTLRSMIKLEMLGMSRSRGPSAYSLIKSELGLKGTREKVLAQMNVIRDELLKTGSQ
jgi:hypothetical protein